jgi:predicted ATPase
MIPPASQSGSENESVFAARLPAEGARGAPVDGRRESTYMPRFVMQIAAECPKCGFDNPRGWTVCARCGSALSPAQAGIEVTVVTRSDRPPPPGPEIEAARASSPEGPATDEPMGGRVLGQAHVLGHVRQCVEAAYSQGTPRVLVVEGEPGSGRTYLLRKASAIAALVAPSVRVLYGARRHTDDSPYAPFARLLRDRFGVTPSEAPSRVRANMTASVTRALGSNDLPRVAETTHLIGLIAGVPFPNSPFLASAESDPLGLQKRAAAALRRFLEGDARDRPLLLLLDDMTGAEDEAWGLLDTLIGSEAPIAVVMAGESPLAERTLATFASDAVDAARIVPLNANEVEELVRATLPGLTTIPSTLLDALMHRTRGNPTTVKELLTALIDGGLFRTTDAGIEVRMERLERGDLPLTMADAIRARLGRLSAAEQRLMKHAAVIGEVFWDGALLALDRAGRPIPDASVGALEIWNDTSDERALAQTLDALVERRFVARLGASPVPGLAEFTFQYAGTRRVIYEDLPDAERAEAHAIVARWLALSQGPAVENKAAAQAPHLERAGFKERAAQLYMEAAAEARRQMRNTMALRYVDRSLALLAPEHVARHIEALHERGSLLTVLGRYDEAHAAFDAILRQAWAIGARGRGGAALNRIARIYRQRGEHDRALAYLEKALELFRSASDERGVASTFDDMAQVHRLLGHLDEALAAGKAALEIRARTKDERGQGVSLNTMGYIELDRGNFDAAEARLTKALHIRQTSGDHEGAVQTRIGLGRLAYQRGEVAEAIQIFAEALSAAREMDNQRLQTYLLDSLGEAYAAHGQPDEAEGVLREAKALAEGMRDQRVLADIERNLGIVAVLRGDDGADATLTRALELAQTYGTREAIALAHLAVGRRRARTLFDTAGGTGGDAETSFRESIRAFRESGNRHQEARAQAELALHLVEKGDRERAKELLRQAVEVMQQLRLPDADKARDTLAQL